MSMSTVYLNIIFWNAGGLVEAKIIEFDQILSEEKPYVFGIVEVGLLTEIEDKLRNIFPNYQLKVLERDRQISSGILIGVKNDLVNDFHIIKHMNDDLDDKLEAVKIVVWKDGVKLPITFVYNPPRNVPDLELLQTDSKMLLIGDFNAPSTRWGYRRTTPVGKAIEDFLDSHTIKLIQNDNNEPTFISYIGATSNPDMVFCHDDLADNVKQNPIDSAGGFGHKVIKIECSFKSLC